MSGKSLDDILSEIIEDYQAVATKAIKSAAKKVQDDVVKEAYSYLQEYYNNYPNPKRYKRTNRLRRAITPYWADRTGKNGISIEVGVQYSSSGLKGAYRSNSWYHQSGDKWVSRLDGSFNFNSMNNGIPEPEWILDNFLKGEHPISKRIEQNGYYRYEYAPKVDKDSTESLMEEFFDTQLPERINKYVQDELFNTLTSMLKTSS